MESARPVLVISYHFEPSPEVGGRRAAAFVQALASGQVPSVVISAFGGEPLSGHLATGVSRHQIMEPRKMLIDSVIRIKRLARALRPSRGGERRGESAPSGGLYTRDIYDRSLRGLFLQTISVVDEHKHWAWQAARAAICIGRRECVGAVIASGPPMSSLLAASWSARRLGVPAILDFRDPWVVRPIAAPLVALSRRTERFALSAASAVTCTSGRIAGQLLANYPRLADRVVVITNGYDGDIRRLSIETGHRISMLFAGELYANRDPFPLFDALDQLLESGADASRISIRFITGNPVFRGVPLVRAIAGRPCAGVVEFLPATSPAKVQELSATATVLLNLAQQQPRQIPAKTFEHLASGREVLVLCEQESETAGIVDAVRNVLRVDPADSARLAAMVRDLYQRHVVEGTLRPPNEEDVQRYSRVMQNERFSRLVRAVTHGQSPRDAGLGLAPT